jgi:Macrocin-O-methyltransferase (TylF)
VRTHNRAVPALRRVAHRTIQATVAGFNRNPWTAEGLALVPRTVAPLYTHDGLRTAHNHTFIDAPDFQRAYRRAVQAAGWDYGIYWRVHVILWAARTAQTIPGAFVECGTGRGFMASAICEDIGWDHRPFYLFDTFQPGSVILGSDERGVTPSPVYALGAETVRENFREWAGVQLVVGRVPDTLGHVEVGPVAFLHIDMNDPAPEAAALRHFWPSLSPGAVVVLDDYAYQGFEASHRSADSVASELGVSIVSLPTGQGLTIKPFEAPVA